MLVNSNEDVHAAFRVLRNALHVRQAPWSSDDTDLVDALGTLVDVCWWSGRADYWDVFTDALQRFSVPPPDVLVGLNRTFKDPARATIADGARQVDLIVGLRGDLMPSRAGKHPKRASATTLRQAVRGIR
jgi:hypothetical protein